MKLKKQAYLIGSLALATASIAQAAQIDVCGVVTSAASPIAPINTTTGSGVRGVRAITTNQTWTKNNEYFLTDRVFVPNGITLTIEPGTKIYSSINDKNTPADKSDDAVGSLIAARGGRIVADGTAAEPITFTAVAVWEMLQTVPVDSQFDPDTNIGVGTPTVGVMPGAANGGLWGGMVVLGNAYVLHLTGTTGNNLGNALIEGFVPGGTPDDESPTDGLPDASEYGFDATHPRDDNDDSGVYRYITISHGGYEFEAGREINGLTLAGVGAGTIIDHIEVFANADDGIEFFGGTCSSSHIFLAYNQDDNYDFDSGYTGTMQFFFSVQNPGFADGGFEHDGIEGTTTTQAAYDAAFTTVDATFGAHVPKAGIVLTKPRLFNGTVIGPGRSNTNSTIALNIGTVLTEKGNHGFIYDDYYNGDLYNSVVDDFSQDLAFFRDGAKSYGATADVRHNTLGRFGSATNWQIDTATAAGTITASGNVRATVTGALVSGSPLVVDVAAVDTDTAATWAGKVRTALNALPAITTNYVVSGSGASIVLRAKLQAANDSTLNIALANASTGGTTGVTAAATSANTVAGGSSVTIGQPLTYISGTNVRSLFMDVTGAPTGNNSPVNTDPLLTTYNRDGSNVLTAIDPRPTAGSPLLSSNGATLQAGAPMPVNYRGAFGPGADANWAGGWTKTWSTGILQGGYSTPTPPFADADGDGISDTLEATAALTALGFSTGVNNVTPTNLFSSIYTAASIVDLSADDIIVQKVGSTATLNIPVESSNNLVPPFTSVGNATLSIPNVPADKQFYRFRVAP